MELLAANLNSIILTGVGLTLALLGYRLVRFHALTMGVISLAAAGAAGGLLLNSPIAMAGFALAGGILGYFLGPIVWHVYVALVAAAGGAAIGILLCDITHAANPRLVVIATAVAFAVIALLDAKVITIAWTSLMGAGIAKLGLAAFHAPSEQSQWQSGGVGIAFFAVALLFQFRTNREPEVEKTAKPSPMPKRAPETVAA